MRCTVLGAVVVVCLQLAHTDDEVNVLLLGPEISQPVSLHENQQELGSLGNGCPDGQSATEEGECVDECPPGKYMDRDRQECALCLPFDLLGGKARKRGQGACRAACNECKRVFPHPQLGQIVGIWHP